MRPRFRITCWRRSSPRRSASTSWTCASVRRHRSHAGRPRLVLEPGHVHGGQRGAPGCCASCASSSLTVAAEKLQRRRPTQVGLARPARLRRRRIPRTRLTFLEAAQAAEATLRHDRRRRVVHAATSRRRFQRLGRRSVARVLVQRLRRRGRRRSRDRRGHGREDNARARRRPRDQSGFRRGPDRRRRLHGHRLKRSWRSRPFRAGEHKIPNLLDYKMPTILDMPPIESIIIETDDREGPFRRERGRPRVRSTRSSRRSPTRSPTRSKPASYSTPITPDKVLRAIDAAGRRRAASARDQTDCGAGIMLRLPPFQYVRSDAASAKRSGPYASTPTRWRFPAVPISTPT